MEEPLDTIAGAITAKRCVLFLGAGVHAPPPDGSQYEYPKEHRPPLGSELSRILASESKYSEAYPGKDTSNLQRVAWHYETKLTRNDLVGAIRRVLEGKKPSRLLYALAELDFPVVVTTNYDNLFERALGKVEKIPEICVYSPDETQRTREPSGDPAPEKPFILKIHGDINQPASMVISDEDYIRFVMRMGDKKNFHPVPRHVDFLLQKWPVLFMGYSLADYNLRLLFMTLRWNVDKADMPNTYSIDRFPDPLILDVYQQQRRLIHFVVQDLWSFVPELYRRVKGSDLEVRP